MSMTTVANPRTPDRPASRNAYHPCTNCHTPHMVINRYPLTTTPPYERLTNRSIEPDLHESVAAIEIARGAADHAEFGAGDYERRDSR